VFRLAKLPVDSVYFVKAATGMQNALEWLDERVCEAIDDLPPHNLSMLEASLFCLVEHLEFRATVSLTPYGRLTAFARTFGERASAQLTPYMFDLPPAG